MFRALAVSSFAHLLFASGMSVGVALPAFLFEKGRAAPLVLGAIVGACHDLTHDCRLDATAR